MEKYPLFGHYETVTPNDPNKQGDFTIAELFKNHSNTLLFNYSNINQKELDLFNNGNFKVGLTIESDSAILFWSIGNDELNAITVFDARLYNLKEELTLDSNDSLEIHLVEQTRNLLIGKRKVKIPQELISRIKDISLHQISGKAKPVSSYSAKWDNWEMEQLKPLIKKFYTLT